jgi:hypothetical protein
MTFLDLYGAFLDQELGTADRTNLFTIAKRKAAINLAQLWFTTQTACLQTVEPIPLVTGVAEYSLETIILTGRYLALAPDGPELFITHTDGTTLQLAGQHDFPRRTEPWLNTSEPGWRSSQPATPTCWYETLDGAAILIGLHPSPLVPAGETWRLDVPYVMKPDAMVTDTDQPFTIAPIVKTAMEPWHRALGYYAAHDLEKLRKDLQRSAAALVQAQAEVDNYLGSQHVPQSAVIQPMRLYRRPRFRERTYGARFGRSPW